MVMLKEAANLLWNSLPLSFVILTFYLLKQKVKTLNFHSSAFEKKTSPNKDVINV